MKDIKGYEGLYAITSCGKVWSYRSKKFLKAIKNKKGYMIVNLCNNGRKTLRVHRLVMETYCPCENMESLEVNHKDENKENNCLNNLEWCNHEYNNNYGTRTQRASKKVLCVETGITYLSIAEAERQTGISDSGISAVCRKKRKTAGGYHWEYAIE